MPPVAVTARTRNDERRLRARNPMRRLVCGKGSDESTRLGARAVQEAVGDPRSTGLRVEKFLRKSACGGTLIPRSRRPLSFGQNSKRCETSRRRKSQSARDTQHSEESSRGDFEFDGGTLPTCQWQSISIHLSAEEEEAVAMARVGSEISADEGPRSQGSRRT